MSFFLWLFASIGFVAICGAGWLIYKSVKWFLEYD
jgi:hypothetical protein